MSRSSTVVAESSPPAKSGETMDRAQGVFGSDRALIELLRQRKSLTVADLISELNVTANAVRQRLTRLIAQGFVARETAPATRGRPSHRYGLTPKALRQAGDNFADLTLVLWDELRAIQNVEVRNGLLKRLANRLVAYYAPSVTGKTVVERMDSIAKLFAERDIPFRSEGAIPNHLESRSSSPNLVLPIISDQPTHEKASLVALACPYPELAEQDRGICAVESLVLSQLVGSRMRLSSCRLDGDDCCRFQTT